MKINDAHCHIGRESFFGSMARLKFSSNNDYGRLKEDWNKYNIQNVVLFPQPGPSSFKRYLGECLLFVLGYCFFKPIDENLFRNVDYSEANGKISELTDGRIEFIPFVNSNVSISDIEQFDIKGVKFYEPFGELSDTLLRHLNENELNLVLHLSTESEKHPENFLRLVENNDGILFQVAHCANGVEEIIDALGEYSNLFVDTSAISHSQYKHIPIENIVREHIDKVLFGSDEPWTKYGAQLKLFETLGLSKNDLENVLAKNYFKLWG